MARIGAQAGAAGGRQEPLHLFRAQAPRRRETLVCPPSLRPRRSRVSDTTAEFLAPHRRERAYRTVLLYAAAGVLLVGAIVGAGALAPLNARLRENCEHALLLQIHLRAAAAEQFLSRIVAVARQIASRTRIRQRLESYNRGEADPEEITPFIKSALADALAQSDFAVGLAQIGLRGPLCIRVGRQAPADAIPKTADVEAARIHSIVFIDDQPFIVAWAPILDRLSRRQGVDVVMFDARRLMEILADRRGLGLTGKAVLGKARAGGFLLLRPEAKSLSFVSDAAPLARALAQAFKAGPGVLHAEGPDVIAYAPLLAGQWVMAIQVNEKELYAPAVQRLKETGASLALTVVLGAICLTAALRPIIRRLRRGQQKLASRVGAASEALRAEESKYRHACELMMGAQARFQALFENSPTPLREEDLSELKQYVQDRWDSDPEVIRQALEDDPTLMKELSKRIQIVTANRAMLKLYGARDTSQLNDCYAELMGAESAPAFQQEMAAIAKGAAEFECETGLRTLSGELRRVIFRWQAAPGCERKLASVLVLIVDPTERREAEARLARTQAELNVARVIQENLLPLDPPHVEGFDMAGRAKPAAATGGDYFDFIPLNHRSLAVAVGDVMGHGLGASLLMAETRAFLRALIMHRAHIPDIVQQMNLLLSRDIRQGAFATLFLSVVDAESGSLAYAGAGHNAFLLDAHDVKHLPSTAFPLGVMDEMQVECGPTYPLRPGDVLLVLTDGVTDSVSSSLQRFGVEAAIDVVQANRSEPAQVIVERLFEACERHAEGMPQHDDMTAVVLKVLD